MTARRMLGQCVSNQKGATQRQAGLTLVELLVAMAVGLIVILAATTALLTARQGFTALDAASQLRDNARFASDFIQRAALQTGYVDTTNTNARHAFQNNIDTLQFTPVSGADNALPGAWNGETPGISSTRANCGTSSRGCGDVLILSNQVSSDLPTGAPGVAMINCFGAAAKTSDTVLHSVFYVDQSATTGEPALMCRFKGLKNGSLNWQTQPLVDGVENFQVLYGVNSVIPGTTSAPATRSPAEAMPTSFLRADQLTVAGNAAATLNNWRRVRSLRIGLVLRGPPGSANAPRTDWLYPLGAELGSDADIGTRVNPASINDTRLRRVVTLTVQLRNYQGLQGT